MLVLDASLTLAYSFESQATPEIDEVMRAVAREGALVPATWAMEHWQGLLSAERRKPVLRDRIPRLWELIRLQPIRVEAADPARIAAQVVPLARKHRLSVYDATYLETALRNQLRLATCDKDLHSASSAQGIPSVYYPPRPSE